jgi:signal transduction histidine kinase
MIANLLDNAIKYTECDGTVDVSVQTDEKESVFVSVTDTGIGISASDQPHIFKRFYRGDPSRAKTGSGLGLSLAQAIAQAHSGNIAVTSRQGQGSTFTVTLPKPPHLSS